jgi:hypothetical protein
MLPVTAGESAAPAHPGRLAPVINIRLETKPETRARKWIGVAAVLGAVAFTIVADVGRQTQSHQRPDQFRGYRSYLQLGPGDNYASTVGKLGPPSRTSSFEAGDRRLRSLTYTLRHYSVILQTPSTGDQARYIGTVDLHGRVLDAVRFEDGSTASSLLHSLPTF